MCGVLQLPCSALPQARMGLARCRCAVQLQAAVPHGCHTNPACPGPGAGLQCGRASTSARNLSYVLRPTRPDVRCAIPVIGDAHMCMRMCDVNAHSANLVPGSSWPYVTSGSDPCFGLNSSVFGIGIWAISGGTRDLPYSYASTMTKLCCEAPMLLPKPMQAITATATPLVYY